MTADRDDALSWWDELNPPFAERDDELSAYEHVRALFRQPLLSESEPPPIPTLRSAAAEKFRSAGLFGETAAASGPSDSSSSSFAPADGLHPPSWKRPARGAAPTILGEDTAADANRGAVRAFPVPTAPRDPLAARLPTSALDDAIVSAAPSATPREPAAPSASSPLDHPDVRTGLALTAADALLTKGIDLAVGLAGGNPAVARKLVEIGANVLAGVLPEPYRASAKSSAAAAAAEAERRVADNERSTRTRAALGTLAGRRAEAEREHAAAIVAGDRAKIADARRETIDTWRAERRARGDGEAEINAGARTLEREHRKAGLRHRLAQMDEAGLKRALDEDEDAKADPALARDVAGEILRLRRDDPARAGEASIEREIAARKRDGRIDTPEEETATRYRLRLDAQARRGIPQHQRRLLTNDERTMLATEYLRIESTQGKTAADQWLEKQMQRADPLAVHLRAEIVAPTRRGDEGTADNQSVSIESRDGEAGRIELAQSRRDVATPKSREREPIQPPPPDFGAEFRAEVRRRHPTGAIPWEDRLEAVAEAAVRRKELPSNAALHLVGAMAGANPDNVRFAAARAIARIVDEVPEVARKSFEPWVMNAAARIVQLEQEVLRSLDPDDAAYPEMRREILRRVHYETGNILPPDFAAFIAAGAGGLAARRAKQIVRNAVRGGKAQDLAIQRLRQDLEPYGFRVTGVKQVQTKLGRTDPDSTIRTKSDRIEFMAEVKVPTARFKRRQRERQESLRKVLLFRVNPRTGETRVLSVSPSTKSYAWEAGTPYDEWLASFLKGRRKR